MKLIDDDMEFRDEIYPRLTIAILCVLVVLAFFSSCATPYGIEKRHERKIAKIKVDSIRASNTKLSRTTRDYNIYTPFNGYRYNWYGTGFGSYRPQVVIPIRFNKRRNGNNSNINTVRGNRGHRPTKPVRVPKVQRPKVRTQGVPVRPSNSVRGRSVQRGKLQQRGSNNN